MWFMCRLCGFRIHSSKLFQTQLKAHIKYHKCPQCKEKGNEMLPALCLMIDPSILKIEQNPILKEIEKRKNEAP